MRYFRAELAELPSRYGSPQSVCSSNPPPIVGIPSTYPVSPNMPPPRKDKHARSPTEQPLMSETDASVSIVEVLSPDLNLFKSVRLQDRAPRPQELHPQRIQVILVLVLMSTVLYGLDSTVVATLATPISSGFSQLHRAAWLNSAYLLSVACCTPLYGKLSDILGRRIAVCFGLSLFIIGSLMCGLAPSMNLLIFARLIQGAGGGGAGLLGSIIISDVVSLRTRGLFTGLGSVCWATGAGLGGVYGGIVADALSWRWAFLLQVPVLMLLMLGLLYMVNYEVPGQTGSWRAVAGRFDWLGSGLLVVGIGSFVFSLASKTNEDLQWSHPLVYVPLILAASTFAGFILVELKVAPEPVLSLRMLNDRSRFSIAMANFLMNGATISMGLFFPMLLQIVRGNSPSIAGLHLIPNTIAGGLGGISSGFYIRTTGKYRGLIQILTFMSFVPSFLLSMFGARTWEMFTWVVLMPQGFSISGFNGSSLIALFSTVSRADVAVATSITFLFRSFGQVIGMAVSSAIQQSVLEGELTKHINGTDAAAIVAEVRRNATSILDLSPSLRDASIGAYTTSLHAVFLANGVVGIVALLFVFLIKEYPLSESYSGEEDEERKLQLYEEVELHDEEKEMAEI